MQAKALKDFGLSRDGVKVEDVKKDNPVDVPDELVEGLVAGGYIELAKPSAKAGKGAKE